MRRNRLSGLQNRKLLGGGERVKVRKQLGGVARTDCHPAVTGIVYMCKNRVLISQTVSDILLLRVFSCGGALVPRAEGKCLLYLRFAALSVQQSNLEEQSMRIRVGPTCQTDQI
jgi:hypothetical protein